MKKLFILLLFCTSIIKSQSLKKSNLIGNWKYKKFILTKEIPQDTIVEIAPNLFTRYGKIEDLKFSDINITKNIYKEDGYEYDFWEVNGNKILLYKPVPKDKIEYYKKYTFNVIKKLQNGKYYFTNPLSVEILSFKTNELITKEHYYNVIYERQKK